MINFQIYKTHIKPIKPPKPALIKPVKPAGLGFMIKPGFYANPDAHSWYAQTSIADTISIKISCAWSNFFCLKKRLNIACNVAQYSLSIPCEALMTQIRMHIRVCQRNMKAKQDCKQVMERAARQRLRRFLKRKKWFGKSNMFFFY